MAVKVTVYGTANMKQITAARGELDKLEKQANINAGGFRGSMQKLSDSASKAGAKMSAVGGSMTKNLTLPILAVGAGLYKATQAAAEDAKAQTVLANTLKATAGATAATVAQTEAWITKQGQLLGVSDDALRPALGTLTTATKDVGKAQQLAATAMDIAAQKGIPVEKAATAVAKAYAGQFGSLQRLIPGIDAAAIKNKDFGAVMDSVNKIVGGQAAAAANTEAGARARANVALQESVEKLGTAFMPIMQQVTSLLTEQVVPAITKVADWFSSLNGTQKSVIFGTLAFLAVLGPAIKVFGMLSTAIGAVSKAYLFLTKAETVAKLKTIASTVVTWAQTAAQWALNVAMSANPIMLVVLAVVALVAILVIAWNNSKQFRDIVIGAWNAVADACKVAFDFVMGIVQGVFNWLKDNWKLVLGIITGPIGLAVFLINKYWDNIVAGVRAAWNMIIGFLKQTLNFLVDLFMNWTIWGFLIKNWNKIVVAVQTAWNKIIGFFQQAPGRILKALGDFGSLLIDVGKNLVSGLWKGIQNSWDDLINNIEGLGGGIVDAMKGVLGIKSPSRVFAGIGANIGAGMKQGIAGSIPSVESAMGKLAGVATGSINTSMALNAGQAFATATPSAALASASSSVSNSSVITVAPGAVQVSVSGGDTAGVGTAVEDAFAKLVRELRSR